MATKRLRYDAPLRDQARKSLRDGERTYQRRRVRVRPHADAQLVGSPCLRAQQRGIVELRCRKGVVRVATSHTR